jgi:hypothetical protein
VVVGATGTVVVVRASGSAPAVGATGTVVVVGATGTLEAEDCTAAGLPATEDAIPVSTPTKTIASTAALATTARRRPVVLIFAVSLICSAEQPGTASASAQMGHPIRQLGWLEEPRGFASPSREGFAFSSVPTSAPNGRSITRL